MARGQTLLIIDPGLKLWGSERALAATLKALTEAWGKVVLVLPPGAELGEEVQSNPDRYGPIELTYAPIGNLHKRGIFARLLALLVLAKIIFLLKPCQLYLNQAGLVKLIAPIVRLFRIPFAVHVRLLEDVGRSVSLRGKPRVPVDVIFISDAMLEAAKVEYSGVLPEGTRWHNAYDPYELVERPQPSCEVAPFVSVARLSHGKGVHLLVEALAMPPMSEARADVFGAGVVGDGYCASLEKMACALDDRIRLRGFHRDVLVHLPGYRFLVSTSYFEPLGRVVIEAWEAGLVPIVYSKSGGAAEMVRKSGGGLLYEAWDSTSLCNTLGLALAMSKEARQSSVKAGRAWVARELSLQVYRSKLADVLF